MTCCTMSEVSPRDLFLDIAAISDLTMLKINFCYIFEECYNRNLFFTFIFMQIQPVGNILKILSISYELGLSFDSGKNYFHSELDSELLSCKLMLHKNKVYEEFRE